MISSGGNSLLAPGGRTMLVLSRKVGEEIVIGDSIRLKVLSIRGNQIRLGFTAPKDVIIHREELCHPATRTEAAPAPAVPRPAGNEALPRPDVVIVRDTSSTPVA
jgi:carbon storage regulator